MVIPLLAKSRFDAYVTTIEILGLECEVYCSRIHWIVNLCKGKMAAQ